MKVTEDFTVSRLESFNIGMIFLVRIGPILQPLKSRNTYDLVHCQD